MPESCRKDDIDKIIEAVRRDFQGPVNKAIDRLLHPHFREYPFLILIDGLLHGLNEMDPVQSIKKFLKYNAPKLVRELERARKGQ
jgi:excinuclease UvrABC nuclease subunit